jgi:serine/threonine protein kinase
VYRDLKPENILLGAHGHCKITDLGLAAKVGAGLTGSAGTRGFYAPEMITKDKAGKRTTYTQVADFWSLGCVCFAFLDGATPFYNQKRVAKFADDFNDAINEATRSMTVEYDGGNFSPKAEDFTRALLTRDPAQRLGAKGWREVEKHAFFLDFDFETLRNGTMMPPFVPQETLNAKDSGAIGSHDKEKNVEWDRADEKQFEQWDFLNDARFEQEVIQSLEWAKEHGDLRDKKAKSSGCTML